MGNGIGLIGFGEAGETFAKAADWRERAHAFDIDSSRVAAMKAVGVVPCATTEDALSGATLVLSLVTADAALRAAENAAAMLAPGTIYCDCNSVAPDTKRAAAKAIEAKCGRYCDVAVLAPVDPARLAVPLLVSGAAATDAVAALDNAGFTNVRAVGDEVGRASAIKLTRSIIVKGIEALTAEMMLTAHAAGVTDEVLASLDASEKRQSWRERADYNLDRMLVHGKRRAAEMYEASEMILSLGISPLMTEACVQWQEGLGQLDLADPPQGHAAKIAAITATPQFRSED